MHTLIVGERRVGKSTLIGRVLNALDRPVYGFEKVLRLRFGLDDGRISTLEEVGEELNTTRERIRHIEAKALQKLRHPFCSAQLRDFL